MVRISWQIKIPKFGPKASLERAVRKALNEEMDEEQKLIDQFTASWSQGSKPVMRRLVFSLPNGAVGYQFSTDSRPFVWVAGGTRIRHANFPGGYSPKTQPGSLRSAPGSPYFKIVSRRFRNRGITARNPHLEIAKQRKNKFRLLMIKAAIEGTARFFI